MAASRNNVRPMRGAPKRLSEIIRRGACDVRTPPSLDPIKRLLGIEPISKEVLKREWATVAKHALSVREDEYLKNTFAFFGLDPDDPGDWRDLAANWAYVLFGRSKPGRRIEWTNERYWELIHEVGRRRQRSKAQLSDRAICEDSRMTKRARPIFGKRKNREYEKRWILRDLIDELIAKSVLTRAEARDIVIRAIEKYTGDDKTRA
jgi:hypothetical protein